MRPRVTGVILAGGLGRRLGGAVKANLLLEGERVVERVAARVAAATDELLVSIGQWDPGRIALPAGTSALPDLPDGPGGPLGGLVAAVDHCRKGPVPPDFIVSVAVDTPLFPVDFVARALAGIGEADAVVAAFGAQDYPTDTLWRLAAIADLADLVTGPGGPRSPKALLAGLAVERLAWPDDPFVGINTFADFETIKRRVYGIDRPSRP